MTKKKWTTILLLVLLGAAVIGAFVYSILSERVKMNDGYATGNTAGNLNNGGLFCESGNTVFFSNPYDGGCLYSMTPDEGHMKKLSSASVSSINADENYVYYYLDSSKAGQGIGYMQRTYGIYRSTHDGKKLACLKRGNVISMQLAGHYLYYQFFNNQNKNGTELHKIKIDKSEEQRVADYIINPASHANGKIYFNGTENDHYLYSLDTYTDTISLLWDGNLWNPVYDNGYFYYMDIDSEYRLCRYSTFDNTVEILTQDRVDFFNICGDHIYYQNSSADDPALKRMYKDGSNLEVVADGVFHHINATSRYVYFSASDRATPVYKTPITGAVRVTTFDAAVQAAAASLAQK